MPKAKSNLESGFTVVRCPYEAAALTTLGLALAENSPGIDNVYSTEMPWAESGGKFNLDTGEIAREPDFLGSVKYYIRLQSPEGYSAKGLRKYWAAPGDVWREIQEMPARFKSANNPSLRYQLKEDIRCLIPAAAVVYMRDGFSRIPRRYWSAYPADPQKKGAWEELEKLHERCQGPSPDLKKIKADMERLWEPALEAAVQQCFANYQSLKAASTGVLPAIRVREIGVKSWPLVLPMNKHFNKQKILWT